MRYYPDAERGALNLLQNRQELGRKLGVEESAHTPPASHYPHIYLWDSCFAAIINARASGRWELAAKTELLALIAGQREDGFISGTHFAKKGRRLDPERWVFGRAAKGSNYSQPPMLALATAETYHTLTERDSADADLFLNEIYPSLKNFYKYFEIDRSNGPDDKLIGVIHPHETGRDSDPTFDFIKPARLVRKGVETPNLVDKANIAVDYLSILAYGLRLRSAKGDTAKAREIFWVNDVMMNCIYADNLYQMAGLAKEARNVSDSQHFYDLAQTVEQKIIDKMWFPDARDGRGAFHALNKDGNPILETSISNLFPLVLPNLREDQLESLLDLMDASFDTSYPLPSVATDSSNYDPHNQEQDRLWRGPTWINTNWYLVESGLKAQINRQTLAGRPDLIDRCMAWEQKVIQSSRALLNISGPYEHYNPITGQAQRTRVKNFAWSNLGYVMLQSTQQTTSPVG